MRQGRISTRARDDEVLLWIAARTRGTPTRSIADIYRVTIENVLVTTNKIMAADLNESGEDTTEVRSRYWK